MTLGYICSFIFLVFGLCAYLLAFLFRLFAGALYNRGRQQYEADADRLRQQLAYTRSEYLDAFTKMHKLVATKKIINEYRHEMYQLFGNDWADELDRMAHREKIGLQYSNLYMWLARIDLARNGKCDTNMLLNFDGIGPTEHNLMAVKCIEDNLRKYGLDVRMEIAKVNNTSYYARVSNLEFHGALNPPTYMWEDIADVKRNN